MKNTVIAATTAVAMFMLAGCNPVGLEVTVSGSGTVTSSDGTIVCPGACTRTINSVSETITLHAAPASGYQFYAWDGDCVGHDTTCVISASNAAPSQVFANFVPLNQTVADVEFVDDQLSRCVKSAYNGSTPITNVVEINCEFAPVSQLDGIEQLTHLKSLRLVGSNQIADITPLTQLPNFSVLSLSGLSDQLVRVVALADIGTFSELYLENAPNLACADLDVIRSKVGTQNVIIGSGVCSQ